MSYACKILADSICADHRLTTFEVTFPRIILAEFNTHRALSRNSASSRAIPVEKRIALVQADPFIPEAFGKNQPGMQAGEDISSAEARVAERTWRRAARRACEDARELAACGVHKQLANRLLEPFLWQTVIVSATTWSNFFALRCHPAAQPEIRRVAEMMRDALRSSTPRVVTPGGVNAWHRPLCFDAEGLVLEGFSQGDINRISIGRCARVSYVTHDGRRDPAEDIALAKRLQASGHMSPFEHVARPVDAGDENLNLGNFRGWVQVRKLLPYEDDFAHVVGAL